MKKIASCQKNVSNQYQAGTVIFIISSTVGCHLLHFSNTIISRNIYFAMLFICQLMRTTSSACQLENKYHRQIHDLGQKSMLPHQYLAYVIGTTV